MSLLWFYKVRVMDTILSFAPWWIVRKDELNDIDVCHGPVLVYDEETINDTLFDWLYMEGINRLLFPPLNIHARISENAWKLGATFKCYSMNELHLLTGILSSLKMNQVIMDIEKNGLDNLKEFYETGLRTFITSPVFIKRFTGWDINLFLSINDLDNPIEAIFNDITIDERDNVSGLALNPETHTMDDHELEALINIVDNTIKLFPMAKILILGRPILMINEPEQGYPDWNAIKTRVEIFNDRFPEYELWADPGRSIISHAGGLMIEVDSISEGSRIHIAFPILKPVCPIAYNLDRNAYLEIVSISNTQNNTIISLKGDISRGDRIIFPCFDPDGMMNENIQGRISIQYLNARNRCVVKI